MLRKEKEWKEGNENTSVRNINLRKNKSGKQIKSWKTLKTPIPKLVF